MAITIAANLSKKLPIPGENFSSQSASITITAEVTDLSQVVTEAQKLYRIAEQAVDAQLAGTPTVRPVPVAPTMPAATSNPPQSPAQRTSASPPYRGGNQQRRAPAPVTESQLRFLDRLITQTNSSVAAILQQHQIGALRDLSCKAAAGLIDELKAQTVPA